MNAAATIQLANGDNVIQMRTPATVLVFRKQCWDNGYRPVAISNIDYAKHGENAGKAPLGDKWPDRARLNPPEAATATPISIALNTGILCDGLRAVDVDIDDAGIAMDVQRWLLDRTGHEAPMRYRHGSSGVMRSIVPRR